MSINVTHNQSIDLGFHPEVCLSHKYGCGDEGAAISLWLKIPECTMDTGIISSLQGLRTNQAAGLPSGAKVINTNFRIFTISKSVKSGRYKYNV